MTRIASLCSGYEGIGLGLAEALGIDLAESLAWHAENDDAPARIHQYHFPGIPNYRDIKSICWPLCEPVDWLTAGYPCQPFSLAGLRKGADDPRHLWPYIAEAVRILRPGNVLLENVPGHLSSGFGTVLGDLAEIGYDARWVCLPASGVGAPHRRARVFILATDTADLRRERSRPTRCGRPGPANEGGNTAAHTGSARRKGWPGIKDLRWPPSVWCETLDQPSDSRGAQNADTFGTYAPAIERWELVTRRTSPRPTELNTQGGRRLSPRFGEWMMGLPDGWVTSPEIGLSRSQQLKAIGNGVVPQQCAEAVRWLLQDEAE